MPQPKRLFSIFLISLCSLSTGLACTDHCDKTKCAVQLGNCSSGHKTLDTCECCTVCLQEINQTCGGVYGELGRCKDSLECIFPLGMDQRYLPTDLGVCQDATDPACDLHHSWGCIFISNNDCACVNISTCQSHTLLPFQTLEECKQALRDGFNNIRMNCSSETCLRQTGLQVEKGRGLCPEDSYQIMDKPKNQHQGCECLPSACQTVKCPDGFHPKIIRQGSKIPGSCCTLFECVNETAVCEYEMMLYVSGETWTTNDGCSQCYCDNGLTLCQVVNCDNSKACGYMTVPPGECCPVCNGCISPTGKMNKNGVMWKEDDCTTCQCLEGKLVCQAEMCQTSCSKPRTISGHCCPVCDDANSVEPPAGSNLISSALTPSLDMCRGDNKKQYGVGEMWFDGCRRCYCHNGREMCAVLTCPVLHCSHPRLLPGICCPTCSRKTLSHKGEHPYSFTVCQAVDGNYHVEGETWSLDPCTWCICLQGQVLCEATRCPPTPCMHPTHHLGSCCSTCADPLHTGLTISSSGSHNSGSTVNSSGWCYGEDGATVYVDGHKWRPTPCQSCICFKGKVQCFQESCPPLDNCPHPMLVKHRCCPVCLGSKNSRSLQCFQDGKTYRDGERWTVNECTSCVCLKGMQTCTEKICSPWCPQPLQIPGQCCPICKGDGVEYNHQSHSQQHLSMAMVIICAGIMLLLFFVVIFLVLVLLRQRKVLNNGNGVSQGLCPRQRPKSTNLELQGMSPCSKPLLESAELKKLHDQGSPVMKNMV